MIIRCFLVMMVVVFTPFDSHAGSDDKVYKLPAHYIAKHIKTTQGQKRVLMIYASWCPSCVRKMPDIMDIERVKEGSVIAVAVDRNFSHFARYIRKLDDVPFKVIVSRDDESKLADVLADFGVTRWEYIPNFVLLDENNNIVDQGSMDVGRVAQFILQ